MYEYVTPKNRHRFVSVWLALQKRGEVDDYGGAQFRRVYGEWVLAGKPHIETFIAQRKLDTPPTAKGGAL